MEFYRVLLLLELVVIDASEMLQKAIWMCTELSLAIAKGRVTIHSERRRFIKFGWWEWGNRNAPFWKWSNRDGRPSLPWNGMDMGVLKVGGKAPTMSDLHWVPSFQNEFKCPLCFVTSNVHQHKKRSRRDPHSVLWMLKFFKRVVNRV